MRKDTIKDCEITQKQMSIITGSLLGDGHLSPIENSKSRFDKKQTRRYRSYLEWHFEEMKPMSCGVYDFNTNIKKKKYPQSQFTTYKSELFVDFRNKWYPLNKKIVPKDIILDSLALTIWFMDDGSNCIHDNWAGIYLHTLGFTKDDCDFLVNKLNENFGIKSSTTAQKSIYIKAISHDLFLGIIKPLIVWDCFNYKIKSPIKQKIRYISAFGERKNLTEWSNDSRCSISPVLISERIKNGWEIEDAISTPPERMPIVLTAFDETKSAKDWLLDSRCKLNNYARLWKRINSGWSSEKAISTPIKTTSSKNTIN